MRNRLFVLWAIAIVAVLAACFDKIENILVPTQTQGQGNGGDPTASPSPTSSCGLATTEVRVSLKGGGSSTLTVGDTVTLDASPFSVAGKIPDECNATNRVTWSVTGPCSLQGDTGGFNPDLRGDAAGTCEARATVDNVQSAGLSLRVVE